MNLFSKLLFLIFITIAPFGMLLSLQDISPERDYLSWIPKERTRSFQVYLGPQIYHVLRKRAGGTHQSGEIYAIRGGYERIKRSKIYLGFDTLYGSGVLTGKSGSKEHLKSNFSDCYVEGRLGYTLQSKVNRKPRLTPYLGCGYFIEKNHYAHPKGIPIHFRTTYYYAALGALSEIQITRKLSFGVNGEVRYPYDPKCRVSNDPNGGDSDQIFKEKIQYRVELPISYKFFDSYCSPSIKPLFFQLVPFYERREYGYHPNYPHDFLKTHLDVYGAFFKLVYSL